MFFERKEALKRNVATRQPARDVGQILKDGFEFELGLYHLLYISVAAFFLKDQLNAIRHISYRDVLSKNCTGPFHRSSFMMTSVYRPSV